MSLKMYGKYNNKEERDNDKPARKKMAMAKKMSSFDKHMKAEMKAHKQIGSSGPAHVRSAKENETFHKKGHK